MNLERGYKPPRVPDTPVVIGVNMYAELKLKICKTCKQEKSIGEFSFLRGSADRLRYQCRDCTKNYNKEYWAENRETYIPQMRASGYSYNPKRINYQLIRNYGITLEDYEKMFKDQEGKCAICGHPETHPNKKRLAVDHCHKTGKVRGLLCNKHNRIIGTMDDSVEELKRASAYLEKFKK